MLAMEELLNSNDLFVVWFKNLTSETIVSSKIKMISFSSSGCIQQMPVKSCSGGHKILLCLNFESSKKTKLEKKVEIIGNIAEVVAIDEKFCEVSINFNQFIKEEWHQILDKFSKKQENVNLLINKLKKI